jgi:hypothetical protein
VGGRTDTTVVAVVGSRVVVKERVLVVSCACVRLEISSNKTSVPILTSPVSDIMRCISERPNSKGIGYQNKNEGLDTMMV